MSCSLKDGSSQETKPKMDWGEVVHDLPCGCKLTKDCSIFEMLKMGCSTLRSLAKQWDRCNDQGDRETRREVMQEINRHRRGQ